jgi:hypothetical protein
MSSPRMEVDVGWTRRPMSPEEAARRVLRMLTALEAIDGRFGDLLTGGRGPRSKGWRPLPSTEEWLAELLRKSDKQAAMPGPGCHLGAWNGQRDGGISAELGIVVWGPGSERDAFRSFAGLWAGTEGLDGAQVEAIVAAMVAVWDPQDGRRTDTTAEGEQRLSTFTPGVGWLPAAT